MRGEKKQILDEEKALAVKRVFELLDAKPEASLQKMADMLNSEGYTTKEGKRFHAMQVKRILDRRAFYEGRYQYSGIDADEKHRSILI